MSFLEHSYQVGVRTSHGLLTRSSCTSLNAEANRTITRGAMVVHRFVGDTPGICCMHAVNKKNKLAYLENCSRN